MFKIKTDLKPTIHQEKAILKTVQEYKNNKKDLAIIGITGSGKTFIIANIIQQLNKPAIILEPNKVLAKQVFDELKMLFPENTVEFFISHFDYFIPESFSLKTQKYHSKQSAINSYIESMRNSCVMSCITKKHLIIVASVAAIFGGGETDTESLLVKKNDKYTVNKLLTKLKTELNYRIENKKAFGYAKGIKDKIIVNIGEKNPLEISIKNKRISSIKIGDKNLDTITINQGKFSFVKKSRRKTVVDSILQDLQERIKYFISINRKDLADRLEKRTKIDIKQIEEIGWCDGFENYIYYMNPKAEMVSTILHNLKNRHKEYICFLDESHIMLPQIEGMHKASYKRIKNLVEQGFRLPSALHNMPLTKQQFNKVTQTRIYVSATLGKEEIKKSQAISEINIRPAGLLDPSLEIVSKKETFSYILKDVVKVIQNSNKAIVATTTKQSAQNISEFLLRNNIRSQYIHSDLMPFERQAVIQDIKKDRCDVVVGINLLREGIDLPQIQVVYVVDADRQGFIRSETSILQLIGRAARNNMGRAVLFCDHITDAIKKVKEKTEIRRQKQISYNKKNNILPKTIIKKYLQKNYDIPYIEDKSKANLNIAKMNKKMNNLIKRLEFEKAEEIKEAIDKIKQDWGI